MKLSTVHSKKLHADVLRALARHTGFAFLPKTERRIMADNWIKSLSDEQKQEVIEVIDECSPKDHPYVSVVSDALSNIANPDGAFIIFPAFRYRSAFNSPWKQQYNGYTRTLPYIVGLSQLLNNDLMNCSDDQYKRISAVLRYTHDIDNNPYMAGSEMTFRTVDKKSGHYLAVLRDINIINLIFDNYQRVDDLSQFTMERGYADAELLRNFLDEAGSRALSNGIL